MPYNETPHACFKVVAASLADDDELRRMFAHRLGEQFEQVRLGTIPLVGFPSIRLQVGQQPVTLLLKKSRHRNDEWVLLLGPSQAPRWMDVIRVIRGQRLYSPELAAACRGVHAVLTTTPVITAVRWYFQGSPAQSRAVATPDELPWTR